jgi:hypothetical protein
VIPPTTLVLVLAGIALAALVAGAVWYVLPRRHPENPPLYQEVFVSLGDDFHPTVVNISQGRPVKLRLLRREDDRRVLTLHTPDGRSRSLEPAPIITIDLDASKPGSSRFRSEQGDELVVVISPQGEIRDRRGHSPAGQ